MRKNSLIHGLAFFGSLIIVGSGTGCKKPPRKKIPATELASIKKLCSINNQPISLYYLDGNCSFCLAKAKEFDDEKYSKGTGCVIMFQTSNPIMTKQYIRNISLRSCVILDSTDLFAKSFMLNSSYEITEQGEILSEKIDN